MINFVAGGGVSPKFGRSVKTVLAVLAGCWAGVLWGKVETSERQQWCHSANITEYECEDQINQIIQGTKKPAVIYYYLPLTPYHYLYRAYMLKYSNKYPQNATWVLVNLVQHLQQAKEGLRNIIFPLTFARIEVRFPKTGLDVYEQNEKQEVSLIKETVGNRREVFNYGYHQSDFQAFLEENGVMKGEDPVESVLKATELALFQI